MPDAIAFALLLPVLALAAVSDLRTGKVPNRLTYPAILLGVAYWLIVGITLGHPGATLARCGLGLAAGLVPAGVIVTLGGLGGGDMKLLGAIGAIAASWPCVLSTAVYALVLGMVVAIGIMVARRRTRATLGRMLGITLMLGARTRPETDPDSPTVPFALMLAIGGIVAGAEQLLAVHTPWAWLSP